VDAVVKDGGCHVHHGDIDQSRQTERDHDVDVGEANKLRHVGEAQRRDAILRQAGVEIDDVRHDRRADDADGQQYAVGIAEPRNDGVIGDLAVAAD